VVEASWRAVPVGGVCASSGHCQRTSSTSLLTSLLRWTCGHRAQGVGVLITFQDRVEVNHVCCNTLMGAVLFVFFSAISCLSHMLDGSSVRQPKKLQAVYDDVEDVGSPSLQCHVQLGGRWLPCPTWYM